MRGKGYRDKGTKGGAGEPYISIQTPSKILCRKRGYYMGFTMQTWITVLSTSKTSTKQNTMITGNEPINPTVWDERNKSESIRDNDGLTIRQHLAAMAMQGLVMRGEGTHTISTKAVKLADDLINELNKTP